MANRASENSDAGLQSRLKSGIQIWHPARGKVVADLSAFFANKLATTLSSLKKNLLRIKL